MPFTAGQVLTASALNLATRKRIARARRITNSTATTSTTRVSVLRLDDIPVKALQNYQITYKAHMSIVTATDVVIIQLYYTTDGSTPTSSSSVLPGSGSEEARAINGQDGGLTMVTDYTPAADQSLSLLLTIAHVVGTSNAILQADGLTMTTAIYIDDMGEDPGDTGVDL